MNRGRTEGLRHPEPLFDRVDGDDRGGTGCLRRLHGAEPHGAEAEDRGGLAFGQWSRVDRVVARPHHVAGEQRHVVGEAVRNLPETEVRVRHEQQLGLRPL